MLRSSRIRRLQNVIVTVVTCYSYLGSEGSRMTDSERNQIEAEAETFMKTSSEAIKLFKLECRQTLHSVINKIIKTSRSRRLGGS